MNWKQGGREEQVIRLAEYEKLSVIKIGRDYLMKR